jgi:hypothetical protein
MTREVFLSYQSEIGKTFWSRDKKCRGVVTGISARRCAACGYSRCYLVKWEDGTRTKPCVKGVGYTPEGDLIIL